MAWNVARNSVQRPGSHGETVVRGLSGGRKLRAENIVGSIVEGPMDSILTGSVAGRDSSSEIDERAFRIHRLSVGSGRDPSLERDEPLRR